MTYPRSYLAMGLDLVLAGCISFGSKPPPTLMRLTADAALAPSSRTAPATQAITVITPSAAQEINTPRVPVRTGTTAVAYLPNAQWVEVPSALFGRLRSETIAARTGRGVLDPKQFTFDPGQRLSGTLHTFGLNADTMEAVLIYDAALARGSDAVETRRFEARAPVAAIDAASAPEALNRIANQVAAEVAAWVG